MLHAMATCGADQILCARRRPGARRDGVRDRGPGPGRHDRRRRQRLRRRGQAPAVRPRSGSTCSPGRPRSLVIADAARRPRARRRRPARPGRARADLAGDPDHDLRGARRGGRSSEVDRLLETWPTRDGRRRRVGDARISRRRPGRRRGDRAVGRDRARAPRGAGRRGPIVSATTSTTCATTARCSSATRRPSPTATRRIGTNHVLPTMRRRALHRRPVGRQVPQDLHLPAA